MNEEIEVETFNIITENGEIKWGPFATELEAHNKLQQLIDNAIGDECDGLQVF